TPAQIQQAHQLMVSSGAVRSVAEEVRARATSAREILDGATGIGEPGRAGLAALAAQATDVESLPR
ncbi:MAG: polyprenyl synthetase family protein, partial [Brachybacterium tyrofermentans]